MTFKVEYWDYTDQDDLHKQFVERLSKTKKCYVVIDTEANEGLFLLVGDNDSARDKEQAEVITKALNDLYEG